MSVNLKNPQFPAADPFILLHNDKYYLYPTNEGGKTDGVIVYESDDLCNWENKGYCLNNKDVIGNSNFWAPEVTFYNNKFYMVFTADEHIGIAVSDSPLGPFIQKDKHWLIEEKAIDGHFFFDDDGSIYLYYVKLVGENKIFVSKMNNDLLSIDQATETLLIEARDSWETIDCLVAEGPFVLKHKGLYYLTYSANHTRNVNYAVGYATSSSPFGPFKKYDGNPILKKNNDFVGVGHHSFTTTKDKKELIIAYHCHNSPTQFIPRLFCVNKAYFNEDGILIIDGPKSEF